MIIKEIEKFKDKKDIALIEDSKIIYYKDLIKSFSENDEKIIERSIVFIIAINNIDSIIFYLKCLKQGAIVLLLNHSISFSNLRKLIQEFNPSMIFSIKEFKDLNTKTICFPKYIIYLFKNHASNLNSNITLLLTTSGSTGDPKLVMVSNRNLYINTESISNYLSISSKDRHITTLPFNYTYGLSCINTHLFRGASIVLNNDSIISPKFIKRINEFSPTTFAGVPYTYETFCRFGLEKLPFSSIQKMTQAGGKLNEKFIVQINKFCSKYKKEFFIMYGQTEATARMSYLPPKMLPKKIGSIGVAIPGGNFKIINKKNYDSVNNFEVGELVYEGENVTLGYAINANDLKKTHMNKKVLHTGDLAYIDDDGYFFITGRINRFAKINGLRVSLDSIENKISKFYKNAVISDDKYIYIFVEENTEKDQLEDLLFLKDFLKKETEINPISFKLKWIKKLPRKDSGKLNYIKLEQFK